MLMHFSVGQVIKLKDTGEEAEILEILNKKVFSVFYKGEEHLIHLHDILIEETKPVSEKQGSAKSKKPVKQEAPKPLKLDGIKNNTGFYLVVRPNFKDLKKEEISSFKLFLVNKTPLLVRIKYVFDFSFDQLKLEKELLLDPDQKTIVEEIPFEWFDGKQRFTGEIVQLGQNVKWLEGTAFTKAFKYNLSPKKLFEYLEKMKSGGVDYFEILLASWDKDMDMHREPVKRPGPAPKPAQTVIRAKKKDEPVKGLQNIGKLKRGQSEKSRDYDEIDLHAEALHLPIRRLDNFEILTLQLDRLEKAISLAVRKGKTSLIIIHGVGTGKLREEVQRVLAHHSSVAFFQSTWRPGYGNGATEAFLK